MIRTFITSEGAEMMKAEKKRYEARRSKGDHWKKVLLARLCVIGEKDVVSLSYIADCACHSASGTAFFYCGWVLFGTVLKGRAFSNPRALACLVLRDSELPYLQVEIFD